jgi:hypothetical protein
VRGTLFIFSKTPLIILLRFKIQGSRFKVQGKKSCTFNL